jgi:Uncharacterized conserved protein
MGHVSTIVSGLEGPTDLVFGSNGKLYVADGTRILEIDGGTSRSYGSNPEFSEPMGLAIDRLGNLYVSDIGTDKIYRIETDETITVLAGSTKGFRNGPGLEAKFDMPHDLFVDEDFNVYVSDSGNYQIRKIDSDGHVSSFAGSRTLENVEGEDGTLGFEYPIGITQDYYGNLYVADFGNSEVNLIQVIPDQLRFTIEIEDEAGNFVSVNQTSDNSNIAIDLEAPEILSSVLLSDNPNTVGQLSQLAKENENISLTVRSSEPLQSLGLTNVIEAPISQSTCNRMIT